MGDVMDEPVELKTERLLLRQFRLEDVDDVFVYLEYVDWRPDAADDFRKPTRKDAEEYVARSRPWRPTRRLPLCSARR